MTEASASRAAILKKIRGAASQRTLEEAFSEYDRLPRNYRRAGSLSPDALLSMLENRLLEYDATVYYAVENSLPAVIAQILAGRGQPRMAIPRGIPSNWLPRDLSFSIAEELSAGELDHFGGLLSGCTAAIAVTGTLVLQNAPAQGPRKLSLVPDYFLCVVSVDDVVETVPEAFAKIAKTSCLPTTFISGPSATGDIEMTRIKGVHGPRFLDVVLLRSTDPPIGSGNLVLS